MPGPDGVLRRGWSIRPVVRAVGWVAALALLYMVAVRTPWGQRIDVSAFSAAAPPVLRGSLGGAMRIGGVVVLAVLAAALAVSALVRRRVRDVVSAAVIVAVSAGATEVLKHDVLTRPLLGPYGYAYNTFPSGHTTAAVSLAVAVGFLAAPAHRRAWLVTATLIAAAVAWVSVVTMAHRPSDVVAGALMVGAVTSVAMWRREPMPSAQRRWMLLSAALFAACVGLVIAVEAVAGSSNLTVRAVGLLGWVGVCAVPVVLVAVFCSAGRISPARRRYRADVPRTAV